MRSIILAAAISISAPVLGEPCFGPVCGVYPGPVPPEDQLCLPDGCAPVVYSQHGQFLLATSQLPTGYPVLGWSGPCLEDSCPDLKNQALADLELTAKRANRAQRF